MSNKIHTAVAAFALVLSSLSLASAQTTPVGGNKETGASSATVTSDAKSSGKASPTKAGSMMTSTKTTKKTK